MSDIAKFESKQGGRVSDVGLIRAHQGKLVYEKSIKEKEEDKILKEKEIHKFDATADVFPVKEAQGVKMRTMPKRLRQQKEFNFNSVNVTKKNVTHESDHESADDESKNKSVFGRSKLEICENLKLLNILEPQEQIKRKHLEKYINMYALIHAKKSIDISKSPTQSRANVSIIDVDNKTNEFVNSSLGKKLVQFSEMNRFKEFLKDKMKQNYNSLTAEEKKYHRDSKDPATYQKVDSVTRMLHLMHSFNQSNQIADQIEEE